jgi:hypothetical protein
MKNNVQEITESKSELLCVLERIAAALEMIVKPDCLKPLKPVAEKLKGKAHKNWPRFARCDGPPNPGVCKYCKAEILWEEIAGVGWWPYDPTQPFPRHHCKEREKQDTANVLPG